MSQFSIREIQNLRLMMQELGEPLINGQPQHLVATNMRPIGAIHARPDPMF